MRGMLGENQFIFRESILWDNMGQSAVWDHD